MITNKEKSLRTSYCANSCYQILSTDAWPNFLKRVTELLNTYAVSVSSRKMIFISNIYEAKLSADINPKENPICQNPLRVLLRMRTRHLMKCSQRFKRVRIAKSDSESQMSFFQKSSFHWSLKTFFNNLINNK